MLMLVDKNIVKELISTDNKEDFIKQGYIEIPLESSIKVNDDIRMYDSNFNILQDDKLIELGFKKLQVVEDANNMFPLGTPLEKIENGKIVAKSLYDFYKEGLYKLQEYEYQCDVERVIDSVQDPLESYNKGHINKEKYIKLQTKKARAERDDILGILDMEIMNPLKFQERSEEEKEELKQFRLQLLDVPQQSGFPENIEWPIVPKILEEHIDINTLNDSEELEDLHG